MTIPRRTENRAVKLPIRDEGARRSRSAPKRSKGRNQAAKNMSDREIIRTTLSNRTKVKPYFKTGLGQIIRGDSLDYMRSLEPSSVDLIVTSPPFGLVRKKEYGNVESHEYVDWFRPFGREFKRLLKPTGSLVIDIGGTWIPGHSKRESAYEVLL